MNIEALVTTVNTATHRVSMHGVRRELLQQQAAELDLPQCIVELPEMPGMQAYEDSMHSMHRQLAAKEFTHAVAGDIFLQDLKAYREELLFENGLQALFPLWQLDSKELMRTFIKLGFKAVVVCVNNSYLDQSFCGRLLDESFIADLPPGVDPCGENGEYHSFVFDGPGFTRAVAFEKGAIVFKEYPAPKTGDCFMHAQPATGFFFQDLLIG